MSQVEFFKANSKGKIEPIENSTSSLHGRRSILIKDDVNSTLWLIHGSAVADSTKKSAIKNADRINEENHGAYNIVDVEYDEAEAKINNILSGSLSSPKSKKGGRSKSSLKSIPKVPSIKKVDEPMNQLEGDKDQKGPEIKEFQISYYVESDVEIDLNDPEIKLIFKKLANIEAEIKQALTNNSNKLKSKKKFKELTDDIINLIYSK